MRILHIINSLHTGGAEKLIIETLPLLRKKNIHVELALLNGENTPFFDMLSSSDSIKIHRFDTGSIYNPLHIFKVAKLLSKFDIVHGHLFPVQYFIVVAKIVAFSKVKLVFTEHSTSNRRLQNSTLHFFERFTYRYFRKVICVSETIRKEILNKLGVSQDKLITINNGINLSKISMTKSFDRSKLGFLDSDKLLIMVAGFRTEKDQDTVIKCIAELPHYYHLILLGDGERRPILEKLIIQQNLQNRVHMLGMRKDVYELLKMCNVAVLSSHWEGLPLSAAESMACGLPTIGSDVPGINEVVSGGGLLFQKGNVRDLHDCILSLEDGDQYHRISLSGKNKAVNYDIEIMVQQLVKMYQDVVEM